MEETIGFKLNIKCDGGEGNKALALCEKFVKKADKLEASPDEVAIAIANLQEWFFDEFGGVPISNQLLDMINKARLLTVKED